MELLAGVIVICFGSWLLLKGVLLLRKLWRRRRVSICMGVIRGKDKTLKNCHRKATHFGMEQTDINLSPKEAQELMGMGSAMVSEFCKLHCEGNCNRGCDAKIQEQQKL